MPSGKSSSGKSHRANSRFDESKIDGKTFYDNTRFPFNAASFRIKSSSGKFIPPLSQTMPFVRNRYAPYGGRSADSRGAAVSNVTYSDAVKLSAVDAKPCTLDLSEPKDVITLQICNLDSSIEEANIRHYLLSQLKPITPVLSLTMESPSMAKLKVPSSQHAKLVVAHLHRKKVGHKRIIVSYLRDPSSAETAALRCQVGGLLKDVPNHSLPVYKFRELFQGRFKSSVSILELYRMPEVCTISVDDNEEKFIALNPDFMESLQNRSLIDSSQHSVPYCVYHFKQEQSKGWAEQEIEGLPNVILTIPQMQSVIYTLLNVHKADIPISSLLYCIEAELHKKLEPYECGVPLEHLVCCVPGVYIANNVYGIKVLHWVREETTNQNYDASDTVSVCASLTGSKGSNDPLSQISREVIELIKMNPRCTMKFNRFIPAYHNHFGKQCRVADYGYTRLIELFEALSTVVQVMGDGENRQVTLTHRTQVRRFSIDLFKVLRSQPTKSILLSQLPSHFTQTLNHRFDVTDYGVCDISDLIDGLVCNNSIVIQPICNGADILISIMKRKQTQAEMEKTSTFAGEVVELFRNAPQYTILFKKFVRSYHYHFGYQCRLSDYGFTKLAELLEAISGILKMEPCITDEDRKIFLCQSIALRVFSEQLQELIKCFTRSNTTMVKLNEILELHKNKFGYQMHPVTLGFSTMKEAIMHVPYIEILERNCENWIVCHLEDPKFRMRSYASACLIAQTGSDKMLLSTFMNLYVRTFNENPSEKIILDMKHAISVAVFNGVRLAVISPLMKLITKIIVAMENRKSMNICQLKGVLGLPQTFFFELGYPNLSSVIQSHHDIFVSSSVTVHERSDISLKADCIFTEKGFLQYIDECKQQRAVNFLSPKMRPSNFQISKPICKSHQTIQAPRNFTGSSFMNENMQGFTDYDPAGYNRSSFMAPNSSFEDLCEQSSTCSSHESEVGISADLFRLPSIERLSSWTPPMFESFYEPPKPDTPPSKVLPLYFDPIWMNCHSPVDSTYSGHSLNIHLPKLKTVNIISPLCTYADGARTSNGNRGSSFDSEVPDKK